MYARLLALCSLLCVSSSTGFSESGMPDSPGLEVYLKGGGNSSPEVLGAMQRELTLLMQDAGYRLEVRRAEAPASGAGAEHLVVVDLRGSCVASGASPDPLPPTLILASSAVADGRVLPFSWVDCEALKRFLRPVLANQTEAGQAALYGRSLGRLLAHEFYHVLARADDHTQAGVAKARFSTRDLLADHFEFEAVALDRLHSSAALQDAGDVAASGR
jgi:hypothetical protein